MTTRPPPSARGGADGAFRNRFLGRGTGCGAPFLLLAALVPGVLFAAAAIPAWQADGALSWAKAGQDARLLREHALRGLDVQESMLLALVLRARGLDWRTGASDQALHDFLVASNQGVSYSAGLVLVSPDGTAVLSSSPPGDVPEWVQRIGPYEAAGTEATLRLLRPASALSSPRFALARPTLGADGQPDGGMAYGAIEPSFFDTHHAALVDGRQDVVALALTDGTLLTRWPRPGGAQNRLRPDGPLMEAIATVPEHAGEHSVRVAEALSLDGVVRHYVMDRVGTYPVFVVYGRSDDTDWAGRAARALPLALLALLGVAGLLALRPSLFRIGRRRVWAARRRAARPDAAYADPGAAITAAARPDAPHSTPDERLRRLSQLRQAERVAVLGQLSTGLAHDFGNLIQSVRSGARLIERSAEDPEKVRRYTAMVSESVDRGQALTRRLTELARRGEPTADAFDLAGSLQTVCELLAHTLGDRWPLQLDLPEGLPTVMADRAEFETVLINLAVNAHDALPRGGTITIEAALHGPTEALPAGDRPDAIGTAPSLPGDYIRVTVHDAGAGMDPDTLSRVGGNFFTTKEDGRGTGLGLAMARDFAGRIGGALRIVSRLHEGTSVTLWLPLQADVPAQDP